MDAILNGKKATNRNITAEGMGDISDYRNQDKLRREYYGKELTQDSMAASPIEQFGRWFKEALADDLTDANAIALATATKEGKPSVRIVLLKGFDETGFRFYTNYRGRKGRELSENPQAALCFYWAELNRQVRVEGTVERTSRENSADYFSQRPRKSQLAAHASLQDTTLSSRKDLEERFKRAEQQFEGEDVPVPEYWGGFNLSPASVEFWQGRPGRLHDRFIYIKEGDSWKIQRLAP